jgi:GNAT superfamily N-acetyltransferase
MNMQCNINGVEYTYLDNNRDTSKVRLSFNELSQNTFGLSFENWYKNGYREDQYIPHVLLDGERVVANASANILNFNHEGTIKKYIQIGTVMTDKDYRNIGLSRFLIQKILEEWKSKCDAIYLFANDSVVDFYPKFGFLKANEYQCQISITPKKGNVRKLNMDKDDDRKLLLKAYSKSNPFSALSVFDCEDLLMFYCTQFMKDCIYFSEDFFAVVIAEQKGSEMLCFDMFCDNKCKMDDLLSIVADEGVLNTVLGFTPKNQLHTIINLLQEENTTLFIHQGSENLFLENRLMFPLLSHT